MKLRVHPLFFLSLAAYTLFGGIKRYLVALLAVFLHECAHTAVAWLAGAKDLAVTFTPYGAMMTSEGEIPHFGAVLAAGPLANLVIGGVALAACWIVPELYGLLKGFLRENALIAAVNLLPAYPLDGARLLRFLFPGKPTRIFTSGVTLLVGVGGIVLFCLTVNGSALIFACFMISYFFAFCLAKPNRRRLSDPLYTLARTDDEGRLLSALVRGEDGKRIRISSKEVAKMLLSYPRDFSIGDAVKGQKSERYK